METLKEKVTPNKRPSRVWKLDNGFRRSTSGLLKLSRTISYLFRTSKAVSLNSIQVQDLQHSKVESVDPLSNTFRELQIIKNGLAESTTGTNLGRDLPESFRIFSTLSGISSKKINSGRGLLGTFPLVQNQVYSAWFHL